MDEDIVSTFTANVVAAMDLTLFMVVLLFFFVLLELSKYMSTTFCSREISLALNELNPNHLKC